MCRGTSHANNNNNVHTYGDKQTSDITISRRKTKRNKREKFQRLYFAFQSVR